MIYASYIFTKHFLCSAIGLQIYAKMILEILQEKEVVRIEEVQIIKFYDFNFNLMNLANY